MSLFDLKTNFKPSGDQPDAIEKLTKSILAGNTHQTLLGVTGSGKTYSMANIIENVGKPTLIMSHNKTLAAQLYSEFKNFFPNNAVEYFVSYFDYYQPEAYIAKSDTYIEKDSSINDEIERLRLSTMGSLLGRKDVIVIASVSCIYGLGSPEHYSNMMFHISEGQELNREKFLEKLVEMLYERNDIGFARGKFRVRGDIVDVFPAYLENQAIRVDFFGDEVDKISFFDPLTSKTIEKLKHYPLFPAKQFVTPDEEMRMAMRRIRDELEEQIAYFEKKNLLLEAQRIKLRTDLDLEMMNEMGFCSGIENYSRHLAGREEGTPPDTLLSFFPDDFLLMIDESHVSIPQIRGMYFGDKARKQSLVEYGFRLPSALDNRPLKFDEFMQKTKQKLYVSATPAHFELQNSFVGNKKWIDYEKTKENSHYMPPIPRGNLEIKKTGTPIIVEQIMRPTGLLEPKIFMLPLEGQIDKTMELCQKRVELGERTLVTTLTKKTAEDLSDYLNNLEFKVAYLHSDIDTIERVEILRDLREGKYDILIGINLLREGLDLPEVSLICILDADKEGYLRSLSSLLQTAGRAARHQNGEVYLFADVETKSIKGLIKITKDRRERQIAYNKKHGITPKTVERPIQESLSFYKPSKKTKSSKTAKSEKVDINTQIFDLEQKMQMASKQLEFEYAAILRDEIEKLKKNLEKTS